MQPALVLLALQLALVQSFPVQQPLPQPVLAQYAPVQLLELSVLT